MADKKGEATDEQPFVSELPHGRERFLAHVIEHALEIGRRSPEDFIRHFPPDKIMSGLRDRPSLRAAILVEATGIKNRIALKKSHTSAGEDLQIALDERETNARTVIRLFRPDDRVRYLDHQALWSYVVESDFWEVDQKKKTEVDRARQHIAYMLDRALVDGLLTHRDIIEGIEVAEIGRLLPREQLSRLIFGSLDNARDGKPFNEVDMLRMVPTTTLVEHIPLPWIWERVVVPRIAIAHGFVMKETDRPNPRDTSPGGGGEGPSGRAKDNGAPGTGRGKASADIARATGSAHEPTRAASAGASTALLASASKGLNRADRKSADAMKADPKSAVSDAERTGRDSERPGRASASAFAAPSLDDRTAPKGTLAKATVEDTPKRPSIPVEFEGESDLPDDQTNPVANLDDIARAR